MTGSLDVTIAILTKNAQPLLRRLLDAVFSQRTTLRFELLAIDSGSTDGTVDTLKRSAARLIEIPAAEFNFGLTRGLAYSQCHSPVVVNLSQDAVPARPDWLERLTAHFSRDDVMAICGNVLPAELGEPSQLAFEDMEMLGKGDRPRVVGSEWFAESWRWPAATWELGATANAAFRREVFEDPAMGLFDEALGAGTPSGCSEDSYLLYRVVRAGHTVVYDPRCWISHRHRSTRSALDHQLRSYYRGAVAHQIATVHHDGDLRGVVHIARIVRRHARSALVTALRRSPHRRERTIELRGVLEGPWAYWTSRRRVPPGEELRRVATGTEERVFPPVRDR